MYSDLPSVAHSSTHLQTGPIGNQNQPYPIAVVPRRDFLRLTGLTAAGLILASHCPIGNAAQNSNTRANQRLNLFVSIAADDTVTIVAHRSEMGQGIRTGLPQVLADEMEADWSKVQIKQAIGSAEYGNQNTDGSRSVRHFYQPMRELGATARALLERAAAQHWQVPSTDVRAQNHRVLHLPTGRALGFGELAEAAAKLKAPDVKDLKLKAEEDFKYIGAGLAPVDINAITGGTAEFGIDVDVPDMVYASIERCPVIGGKLKSLDDKEVRKLAGVLDVITLKTNEFPIGFQPLHGVAVIANNTWTAQQARQRLKCDWDLGTNAKYQSQAHLNELVAKVKTPGETSNKRGDVFAAFEDAKHIAEATYTVPYLAHAPMEPPSATAKVGTNHCELWICTQAPQAVQEHVAKALGMSKDQVTVNVTLLGGAFGRKAKADFAVEAAVLAKQVGKPVKVTWSREDDIQFGYFHALSAQYFKASIDQHDRISGWLQRTSFPSIMSIFASVDAPPADWELDLGFNEMPVHTPNLQHEFHATPASVRIGWMRSVANIHHAFARSSFLDELAHTAGKAPPIFLLDAIGPDQDFEPEKNNYHYGNYGEPTGTYPLSAARFKDVVRKVASYGRWGKNIDGEGWGIAAHRSFVSYVAIATKVKIEGDSLKVTDVHIAIDCGRVINIDRVKAQMEGSVIFGLSLALMGNIGVEDGRIQQSNFDSYPMLRSAQCPKITVHVMDNKEAPGGVGEPGVPPMAPSLTNAIFAACGKRIRALPVNQTFKV